MGVLCGNLKFTAQLSNHAVTGRVRYCLAMKLKFTRLYKRLGRLKSASAACFMKKQAADADFTRMDYSPL